MRSPIPPLIGMGSRDLVCAWLHGCLHEMSPCILLHGCKHGLHQGRLLSMIEGWVVELVCVEGSWDVMGAGLWSASPLSKPSTQTSMVLLFGWFPPDSNPQPGFSASLGILGWSAGVRVSMGAGHMVAYVATGLR